MLFNSYRFIFLFLPVCLAGFWLLRGYRRQWLLAMSVWFFVSFGIRNLGVLAVSALWTLLSARLLEKRRDNRVLAAGIAGLLIFLAFYKYSGVMFPLAISFYTFTQISFLADLYLAQSAEGTTSTFSTLDFLLYILYFPKLLQGPITRFDDMRSGFSQLDSIRWDSERILRGLMLFSFGLAKKVLLADTLAKAADFGYGNITSLTRLDAVLVIFSYALQIYYDFSGYCDMGCGVSLLFGIELPVNFDSPYRSCNINEFWRRWHCTLNQFFTDYVYIPLGGSRKGSVRTYINIMIVFLLSGIWHGSSAAFLLWGALHGLTAVATRLVTKRADCCRNRRTEGSSDLICAHDKDCGRFGMTVSRGRTSVRSSLFRIMQTILNFVWVSLLWVPFRAANLSDTLQMYGRLLQGEGSRSISAGLAQCFDMTELMYALHLTPFAYSPWRYHAAMAAFLAVSLILVFTPLQARILSLRKRIHAPAVLLAALLLSWGVLSLSGVGSYIYMGF